MPHPWLPLLQTDLICFVELKRNKHDDDDEYAGLFSNLKVKRKNTIWAWIYITYKLNVFLGFFPLFTHLFVVDRVFEEKKMLKRQCYESMLVYFLNVKKREKCHVQFKLKTPFLVSPSFHSFSLWTEF